MITLRQPMTLEECQQARIWRNDPAVLPMLRTGYKTEEEQYAFYHLVICGTQTDHRYYAIENDGRFLGMGGLTYLRRTPGDAEISLILDPNERGKGYGAQAVRALLDEAWRLGLESVSGECFPAGPQMFWMKAIHALPERHSFGRAEGRLLWTWHRAP